MSGLGITAGVKTDLRLHTQKTTRLRYIKSIQTYHIAQIPLTSLLDRKLATVAWGIQQFTSTFFFFFLIQLI